MRDVVFIAVIVGFFAVCAAYIRACAWIIGHGTTAEVETEPDLVEATTR